MIRKRENLVTTGINLAVWVLDIVATVIPFLHMVSFSTTMVAMVILYITVVIPRFPTMSPCTSTSP